MKTITLDIIKKNRVYFKCLTENGYEVKLKVTPKSENLALGKQELMVNDCSVRTKYGTDVIYELEFTGKKGSIVTLKHDRYNLILVEKCKNLGGKWDAEEKVWVFNAIVEDKVEELDFLYNSDFVQIEITAKNDISRCCKSINFLGYTIAKASGRDSGAKLGDAVSMITGKIGSGGSMKNWSTEIAVNSKFRLFCSSLLLKKYAGDSDDWNYELISV